MLIVCVTSCFIKKLYVTPKKKLFFIKNVERLENFYNDFHDNVSKLN